MNFVVGAICEELAKIGFYYQQQITKGNLAITDMYYAQAYIRHMMTATTWISFGNIADTCMRWRR